MIKVSTIAIAGGTLVMAAAIGVFMQTGQQDTSSFAPATPVETETLSNLPKDAHTPGSIQETPVQLAAITLTSSDVTRLPDTMTKAAQFPLTPILVATGDEDNFFGKHTGNEPTYHERSLQTQNLGTATGRFGWHYLAGGYAAAWARGNTRAEIFDAFARREVYATTGPRMTVRVFGGFDFTEGDWDGDWVRAGYNRGVPMGGDLEDGGKAPSFLISALKDPDGANLDRVQVVKGWIDPSGEAQERVYDVVWSDMETRRRTGKGVDPVGDTVNRQDATYTNDIGAAELRATWTDPDYREGQSAFYYVRVIEIPTPRWPLFDAVRFGIELPEDALEDAVAQERAYTSPIWLKPKA